METVNAALIAVAAAAGALLAEAAARLIAATLPRLGALPSLPARSATAVLTGLLCAAFALRFGVHPLLPALLFLAVLGMQLARIDVLLHLLPNPLVLALSVGGLLLLFLPAVVDNDWSNYSRGLAGAAIAFVFYLLLAIITPGAMGMGDVKLAAPLGLYLGYLGWPQLLYGVLLGLILNGLVTVAYVALKRESKPKEVAHGPSMLGAAVAVSLFF